MADRVNVKYYYYYARLQLTVKAFGIFLVNFFVYMVYSVRFYDIVYFYQYIFCSFGCSFKTRELYSSFNCFLSLCGVFLYVNVSVVRTTLDVCVNYRCGQLYAMITPAVVRYSVFMKFLQASGTSVHSGTV
jgi:hypothetical protein